MQTECPSRCARPLNKQGSLPPRKCTPAVNCGMFTLLVIQQWCDRRDVGRSFGWKRLSCYEVLFISSRTCMVGRKKACRAETVVHLFKICSARQYVVASVKRIETETIASAELHPSAGHELHQAHRTSRRDRVLVTTAFDLNDGADPARRYRKTSGRCCDEVGKPVDGWSMRRGLCEHARFKEHRGRDQAHGLRDRHDGSAQTKRRNQAHQLTNMTFPSQARRTFSDVWTWPVRKDWMQFEGIAIRRGSASVVHDHSSSAHTGTALPITADAGSGPKYRLSSESAD